MSAMNPNTMSEVECRDAIFSFLGGRRDPDGVWRASVDHWLEQFTPPDRLGVGELVWFRHHPIPPTLDAAAAAMPEGWIWGRLPAEGRDVLEWVAENATLSVGLRVPDTGDERLDRFRLAVACRMSAQEKP